MKKEWKVKKLGDVCGVTAGQSPEGKYYNNAGEGLPFYQGKKEFNDKFIGKPTTWTTVVTKMAKQGDILLSVRAPVGPVNFCTEKICIGRGLASIRATEVIDIEYLYNFLLKHEKEIVGNSGAVFNSINKSQIENILIPIPSFPEQLRIVAILDEAFDAIAKAKENAEKNLQNAQELFESYLQSVFANPGDGWEEKKLGEVCNVCAGQSPEGKYYNNTGEGLPFYQGKKEFNDKYIGEPTTWTSKITKVALQGDVLISVRAPVGPVNFSVEKICIGRGLASIRATELIDREYLYDFLLKHEKVIVGNAGAVFNSINKSQIEDIQIPIPTLSEQQQIVAKLDALSTETKKLEAIYKLKLIDLEELKKSILQKAFNGAL